MIPEELQQVFGKDIAKVYEFTGTIPEAENPQVHITVQFATAINNFLVDCIVTNLNNRWYIYTKTPHEFSAGDFVLSVELPLPEPEPIEPPPESEETV
jgi:hypothetical protein